MNDVNIPATAPGAGTAPTEATAGTLLVAPADAAGSATGAEQRVGSMDGTPSTPTAAHLSYVDTHHPRAYAAHAGDRVSDPYVARPAQPNGLAVWSLSLGLAALIFSWIPAAGAVFGLIAGALAIVFGIMALRRGQSTGIAIPGIVSASLGALTALANGLFSVAFLGLVGMAAYSDSAYAYAFSG